MFSRTRRNVLAFACLAVTLAAGAAHAQSPSGKLVLYTSQPERDAAQTVAAFRKAYPNVEVDVFRSGTTEVMGKLAAEFAAGAPRPDVLLLADAATMEALKKDGRLLAYPQAKVDMDMESGVIAKWLVEEGQRVSEGDILFEMETGKAMMEVEAPGSGVIRDLAQVTGEELPVGTRVAWIDP